MTPLDPGINADAVIAGFTLVFASGLITWGLAAGVAIVRRLLSA